MTGIERSIQEAAEIIASSEALLVCAGAGMGVDSGLPDLGSQDGFWRAFPSARRLGLSYEELASPRWFDLDPELAWGFYGHQFNLYRNTPPHEGFSILRRWALSKEHGYFVFTSNVDGQFQKAGFSEDQIVECRGSLMHLQCAKPCCAASWPAPASLQIDVDEENLRVRPPAPRCMSCGGLGRPNVLMADDGRWTDGRSSAEAIRFRLWLRGLTRGKLSVIEVGAGSSVPIVRQTAEQVARAAGSTLIRINPNAADCPGNCIGIQTGALEALTALDAQLHAHAGV